ncbi:hypothetical protein [Mesorhizobium sp.]|uniref:hypothetical protein n=1 Tax=Mesorhizobium sp. TaxID=1871066 RepID=UPI001213A28C|nr:hypothetical protein [Mesorhizobium sp.]TIO28990.1 MAG: hypothetical protein E5X89_32640 [Mesorhizobium sp.]
MKRYGDFGPIDYQKQGFRLAFSTARFPNVFNKPLVNTMPDPVEVASARLRLAQEMKRLIEVEHMKEYRAAYYLRLLAHSNFPEVLIAAALRNQTYAGTPAFRDWYHELKSAELLRRPPKFGG